MNRTKNAISLVLTIAALVFLVACDAGAPDSGWSESPEFAETRYATAINARGDRVSLADFAGKPVWLDYAAEWCAACRGQSSAIRALAKEFGDGVVFVTVMTSEVEGYGHPATRQTAARWAQSELLDPSKVVAADLTTLTVPQHALFSPVGERRFHHVGTLSAARIRAEIERPRDDRR